MSNFYSGFRVVAEETGEEDAFKRLKEAAEYLSESIKKSHALSAALEESQYKKFRSSTLRSAVEVFGVDSQVDMMIEEMSELTKALLKLRRALPGKESAECKDHIREEIADVQIMLDQMRLIFGFTDKQDKAKIERLRGMVDSTRGKA